jgi:hypothetical protein
MPAPGWRMRGARRARFAAVPGLRIAVEHLPWHRRQRGAGDRRQSLPARDPQAALPARQPLRWGAGHRDGASAASVDRARQVRHLGVGDRAAGQVPVRSPEPAACRSSWPIMACPCRRARWPAGYKHWRRCSPLWSRPCATSCAANRTGTPTRRAGGCSSSSKARWATAGTWGHSSHVRWCTMCSTNRARRVLSRPNSLASSTAISAAIDTAPTRNQAAGRRCGA